MTIKNRIAQRVLVNDEMISINPRNCCGPWIVDTDGKQYLDCFSQFGSHAIGWNHSKMTAIKDQLGEMAVQKLANPEILTEEYAKFVEEFSKITPDFKYHFYVDGGTLGVENALKAAFDWKWNQIHTENMDVLHFSGAFHGRSGYTLSLTNNPYSDLKVKHFPKFPWTRLPSPATNSVGNPAMVESQVYVQIRTACKKNNVAALVLETIQGEGGDNHFRPEFFQELRKLADELDFLLILDEVQTGVGMTGKMWAYEHYGIVPDLIAFGKKTQVCGCASTDRVDNVPNVFKVPSRISSTWGGNIVDMVRATRIFQIIEEDNLVENAKKVGDYLLSKISSLGLSKVRGKGLLVAFDFDNGTDRNNALKRIQEEAFVLSCGEKSIRLRPHLTFTEQDADVLVDILKRKI